MNWNYAYTPYIWPSFATVLLLIALSIYSGRRRSVPGALPFTVACLFAALWAASSVMENAAVDLETKIRAGAIGGKITGAGGGGFLLLYVPYDRQVSVRKALCELRELPFRLEPYGTKVIFNYIREVRA